MKNSANLSAWVEAGYDLFAHEGIEGIQIERLARILGLNKSGFYHYFGDMEGYHVELLKLHDRKVDSYLDKVKDAKSMDPDFIRVLVEYKVPVLFQMQLLRTENSAFHRTAEAVDQKEEVIIRRLWNDYLGIDNDTEMAMRYYAIVRDMCYSRINFTTYTLENLQKFFGEAKTVINELKRKSELAD